MIGEGEKDNAPMLYNGEHVGNGSKPELDVAVDPIDGTRPLAFGRANSIAVVALASAHPDQRFAHLRGIEQALLDLHSRQRVEVPNACRDGVGLSDSRQCP